MPTHAVDQVERYLLHSHFDRSRSRVRAISRACSARWSRVPEEICLEEANASNGPSQNPLHILNTPLSPIHLGLSGKHNSSTNLFASSSSSFVPNYHAAFRVVEVHQNRPNRLYYCGIVSLLVFPILSDTVTTVRRHSRSRG